MSLRRYPVRAESTPDFLLRPMAAALGAALLSFAAHAQEPAHADLAPVVVTASRVEQSSFDVPGAIDSIGQNAIQDGQMRINLSESVWRAPGTVVLNRGNYAQDLQVSIRGFGARSAFGVRGVRLVQDGIPLTMPDGQGQTGTFDLANAGRVEVLRGPFSAAYGNSAGGIIQLFTEDAPKVPTVTGALAAGANGSQNLSLKAAGQSGKLGYELDTGEFRTDGYREHSAATRYSANAKLKLILENDAVLTLLGSWLNQTRSEDALGLTQAQFDSNPRQAGSNAVAYNTRKEIQQIQGGATLDKALGGGDSIKAIAWSGQRHVVQFQSIAASTQGAATSPGGIIDFDREFAGAGLRWSRNRDDWRLSAGVDYETMLDKRKGYQNFLGTSVKPTALGVVGALRRDEDDKVRSLNSWIEGQWRFARDWSLTGGLRNTRVSFNVDDHYLLDGSSGSGNVAFQDTSPTVGLLYKATPAINLFANWGQGFETPTFNEMYYRSGGSGPGTLPGVNFGLKPARSTNMEVGVKAFVGADTRIELALFDIETQNEIVTDQNSGGRTSYRNAGRTARHGIELSADSELGRGFKLFGNYTRMAAYYRDSAGGTTAATTIVAGANLPAVPLNSLHLELSWSHQPSGFSAALEGHHMGIMYANDANSAMADAYSIASLRLGLVQRAGGWETKEFLRGDNLTDRKYVGSVIVNNAAFGYFEPGSGRTWTVGASAAYKF